MDEDHRLIEWLLGGGLVGTAAIVFNMIRMVNHQGQWVGTITAQHRALIEEMSQVKMELHDFNGEMRRWIENHLQITRDIDNRLSRVEARQGAVLKHLGAKGNDE